MSLTESVLFLAVGLFLLLKSAEVVISKGTSLARFLRVSELAIGFLLVSIATTLPEMVVSIIASLEGHTSIVVGNVFGSNIADLCLVLGIAAVVGKVTAEKKELEHLTLILLAISAIPLALMAANFGAYTGPILFGIYAAFAYFVLRKKITAKERDGIGPKQAVRDAALLFLAGAALAFSAKLVVDSAVSVADAFGLTKAFMGATVIAVGTSLPELAVSIQAVARKKTAMALGNVLGAAITNLTLVLGVAAIINPLAANMAVFTDLVVFSLLANVVLWFFIRKGFLGRTAGIVLLGVFTAYLVSLVLVEFGN